MTSMVNQLLCSFGKFGGLDSRIPPETSPNHQLWPAVELHCGDFPGRGTLWPRDSPCLGRCFASSMLRSSRELRHILKWRYWSISGHIFGSISPYITPLHRPYNRNWSDGFAQVYPNWAQRAQARQPRCSASGGSALARNQNPSKSLWDAENHRLTMNIFAWTRLSMKKVWIFGWSMDGLKRNYWPETLVVSADFCTNSR